MPRGTRGMLDGNAIAQPLPLTAPGLPAHTPPESVLAALAMSLTVGLLSGVLPARRSASLVPI